MNIRKLWQQLQIESESLRLEAKEINSHKIGLSVLKAISAFSNTEEIEGGYILLGIQEASDNGKRSYHLTGINNPDEIMGQISSAAKTEFNTPLNLQIEQECIENKLIIAIYVPEAPKTQKPIFIKKEKLPNGAFKRIGSSNQECALEDLDRYYQDTKTIIFDSTPCKDASLEDFDPRAIELYRNLRKKVKPSAEELQWNDEELLHALRCTAKENAITKPTIAGILLFGSKIALRRLLPLASRVDYIRINGTQWVENPEQRFETTLDLRDNLLSLLPRLEATIYDDLPKGFNLLEHHIQRQDKPLIPTRVMREALANALMHRDYTIHSAIQIRRYSDRIEISNSGYSLLLNIDLASPISKTRNPAIASVFHDIDYAENKGSGIKIMIEDMQRSGLPEPKFNNDRTNNLFSIILSFHHFLNDEVIRWLTHFKDYDLTEAEIRALVYTREHKKISNEQYREMNKTHLNDTSKSLIKLRGLGLLEQKGKARNTYYEATDLLLEPQRKILKPISNDQKPISNDQKPISNDQKPISNELELHIFNFPKELANRINKINTYPSKKEEIAQTILDICHIRPFKAKELAKIFNRQDYLHFTKTYLRPLISDKKLIYLYPDNPKHRQQAYKSF